jgi:hypothetical protein
MKTAHLPRRTALVLLLVLVTAFLSGNALLFFRAHAAAEVAQAATLTTTPEPALSITPTPEAAPASADTTGILILGILLVVIILVGLLWGSRMARK